MGAWQTRFQTPTLATLLAELPPDSAPLAEAAVRALGRRPKILWRGAPWNWTIHLNRAPVPVCLIPNPACLVIAVRIPAAFFHEQPPATLPRPLRNSMVAASCVGDIVWTEWSLTSRESFEAVRDLVKRL